MTGHGARAHDESNQPVQDVGYDRMQMLRISYDAVRAIGNDEMGIKRGRSRAGATRQGTLSGLTAVPGVLRVERQICTVHAGVDARRMWLTGTGPPRSKPAKVS